MLIKSCQILFLVTFILTSTAFATQGKPSVCPDLGVIKAEGLTKADEFFEGVFVVYNASYYNTNLRWVFLLGLVEAKSEQEAIVEGNKLLMNVSGAPIPQGDDDTGWDCDYESGNAKIEVFAVQKDAEIEKTILLNNHFRTF